MHPFSALREGNDKAQQRMILFCLFAVVPRETFAVQRVARRDAAAFVVL